MNKAELVEKVAKDTDMTKADSERALNSILSAIAKGVKKAPVGLVGFGTFKQVRMKARNGVNPQTGAKIKIAAKTVMKFKVSHNPKF